MKKSDKKSTSKKEQEFLKEGDEWETGSRGVDSKRVSDQDASVLEARLGLQMISLRLPSDAIENLKKEAQEKGLGYQPYIRQILLNHLSRKDSLERRVSKLEEKLQEESEKIRDFEEKSKKNFQKKNCSLSAG
jgi:predicted DNA binding CopG/RHH family protein